MLAVLLFLYDKRITITSLPGIASLKEYTLSQSLTKVHANLLFGATKKDKQCHLLLMVVVAN